MLGHIIYLSLSYCDLKKEVFLVDFLEGFPQN